jgi:AraC-like DNA-binding protein
MKAEPSPSSTLLADSFARSLHSSLLVTHVGHANFPPGSWMKDTIVTTSRLIVVLSGSLIYTIEGNHCKMAAGAQFLVPAWCWREWRADGQERCELVWCEFDENPREIVRNPCFYRILSPTECKQERVAYRRMKTLWMNKPKSALSPAQLHALMLEGELKSMLIRFWPKAIMTGAIMTQQRCPLHAQVKQALQWIEQHFTESDVLEHLYQRTGLTSNYLRLLFRETMHCSPSEYVKQLRMRHARYLLHTTDLQHKRIAVEVGYADALYFSRIYRQFWGHSPSEEQRT